MEIKYYLAYETSHRKDATKRHCDAVMQLREAGELDDSNFLTFLSDRQNLVMEQLTAAIHDAHTRLLEELRIEGCELGRMDTSAWIRNDDADYLDTTPLESYKSGMIEAAKEAAVLLNLNLSIHFVSTETHKEIIDVLSEGSEGVFG